MVKTVLGVNHSGLTDWLGQRVSAVYMTLYILGLVLFFVAHPDLSYYDWRMEMLKGWVKIATMLFVLSLLFHAWVGMWTIFTDYVKCSIARLVLEVLVFFALVSFFFAALLILWGG